MRCLLKLLLFLIFAPVALVLLLVLAIAAIVGAPLLWEQLIARMRGPGEGSGPSGA